MPAKKADQIIYLAEKVGRMGVDLVNLVTVIPVKGAGMKDVTPHGKNMLHRLRKAAGAFIRQMHYCKRC